MNIRSHFTWKQRIAASFIAVLATSWTIPIQAQNGPPPIPDDEQPEILTRGPVHEAFAEPISFDYEEGIVAPRRPPENIDEIPPADRPSGDQFIWAPGYWSWDGDRDNYIWVSACWRAAPPNMSWVPGYWSQQTKGWMWVAGFWDADDAQEIEYLPAPPPSEAVEAPGLAPTPDSAWAPPCWYWFEGQYIQRNGYWLTSQPGWVWIASHYVWTPRGYVFAQGHWDYPLEDRGVLFAPVYITPTVYGRVGYAFSPSVVIDVDFMSASLFVSPKYNHYYFGDYYDDSYIQIGIFPWFDRERIHMYYDPIYEYDRSRFRDFEPRWAEHQRQDYDKRRDDKDLRPPRTYREMEKRLADAPEPRHKDLQVARPLSVVVNNTTHNTNIITNSRENAKPVKFEKITAEKQAQIAKQATEVKSFRENRKDWEKSADPKSNKTGAEPKTSVVKPKTDKEPADPPANPRSGVAKPREVQADKPEKVNIPKPPVAGKAKARESDVADKEDRKTPAKPADEAKHKDTPKKDDKPTPRATDPAEAGARGRNGG
jgi:hypothetical protein